MLKLTNFSYHLSFQGKNNILPKTHVASAFLKTVIEWICDWNLRKSTPLPQKF